MRRLRFVRSQHVNLFIAVHGVPQAQPRTQLEVARFKAALKQQNRSAPVKGTQALRLGKIKQCKAIRAAQTFKRALDTVAIGIGLDDGPDPCVRRRRSHTGKVVRECRSVNGGENWTGHGAAKNECWRSLGYSG